MTSEMPLASNTRATPTFLEINLARLCGDGAAAQMQGLVYKGMLFLSQGIMISLATPGSQTTLDLRLRLPENHRQHSRGSGKLS